MSCSGTQHSVARGIKHRTSWFGVPCSTIMPPCFSLINVLLFCNVHMVPEKYWDIIFPLANMILQCKTAKLRLCPKMALPAVLNSFRCQGRVFMIVAIPDHCYFYSKLGHRIGSMLMCLVLVLLNVTPLWAVCLD